MGYLNLKPEQTNVFFKLMEERYRRRATIITTNLEYEEWHNFLGNKPLVEALLSRLRHQCHTVKIDGPSLRTPQSPTWFQRARSRGLGRTGHRHRATEAVLRPSGRPLRSLCDTAFPIDPAANDLCLGPPSRAAGDHFW